MEAYNEPRDHQQTLIQQHNSEALCLAPLETERNKLKVNTCSEEASHLEESAPQLSLQAGCGRHHYRAQATALRSPGPELRAQQQLNPNVQGGSVSGLPGFQALAGEPAVKQTLAAPWWISSITAAQFSAPTARSLRDPSFDYLLSSWALCLQTNGNFQKQLIGPVHLLPNRASNPGH